MIKISKTKQQIKDIVNLWYDKDNHNLYIKNSKNKYKKLKISPMIGLTKNKSKEIQEYIKKRKFNNITIITNSKYTNEQHLPLDLFIFKSQKDFKSLTSYLSKNKIQYYGTQFYTYGLIPSRIDYSQIEYQYTTWFLDIETEFTSRQNQDNYIDNITSITYYNTKTKYYRMMIVKPDNLDNPDMAMAVKNKIIELYSNEKDLLEGFIRNYLNEQPDIISGWFSNGYDLPYIMNKMKQYDIFDNFTLIKNVKPNIYSYRKHDGRIVNKMKLPGTHLVDYLDIFKKYYLGNPSSWKLDTIATIYGLQGKTEDKGFMNYRTNFTKFVEYIFRDVELLKQLEEKTSFLKLITDLRKIIPIPFNNLFFNSLSIMAYLSLTHFKDNTLFPSIQIHSNENTTFKGAFVLDPENKEYKNVVVYDYASLYPNIMVTFNIGSDTIMIDDEIDKNNNMKIEVTNLIDAKDRNNKRIAYDLSYQSYLTKTLSNLLNKRLEFKHLAKKYKKEHNKEMAELYSNLSTNYKFLINSFYGVMGFNKFPIYNPYVQLSITGLARFMLNTLKDIILNDLNKTYPDLRFNVIYGDTDSIFVEIDNSNSKIILNNELYEEINDIINENILKRLKQLFPLQYNNYTLKVDVDKIISIIRFFGVKKRYYYLDENNKPKFKGIELARGDIPSKIKDHLHRLFYKALFKEVNNETLLEVFDDIKQSDIQELSTPRNAVMGINDYKVIPNHYRGLLLSKELGINIDMTKTDKIFSIPVILYNTDLELFNKQKQIFNEKRKKVTELHITLSYFLDDYNQIKEVLNNKDLIEVDYLTIFEKLILKKLEQFSELIPIINDVKNSVSLKKTKNNTLSLFDNI